MSRTYFISMMKDKDKRIAELEKERYKLLKRTECKVESFNMDAHNLEQQAKGIEDALECFQSSYEDTKVYVSDLTSRIQKLREQAKVGDV